MSAGGERLNTSAIPDVMNMVSQEVHANGHRCKVVPESFFGDLVTNPQGCVERCVNASVNLLATPPQERALHRRMSAHIKIVDAPDTSNKR